MERDTVPKGPYVRLRTLALNCDESSKERCESVMSTKI